MLEVGMRVSLIALLMTATLCFAQETRFQVLAPANVKHAPTVEHVASLVFDTSKQLGIDSAEIPHIIFVYTPQKAASIVYLGSETSVYVQSLRRPDGLVYEVWVIGDTADEPTVLGIAHALNLQFKLMMSDAELRSARDRVCDRRRNTISAQALREGH
jgi:hypothetical protein